MQVQRWIRWAMLGGLLLGAGAHGAEPPVELGYDDFDEIRAHLIGPAPAVVLPWSEPLRVSFAHSWEFLLVVDAQGRVAQVIPRTGIEGEGARAKQMVQAMRFKPFVRNGRAVSVIFSHTVQALPADYIGPADRAFPAQPDLKQVRIALQRTSCFGSCPSYRLEVQGDGRVTYRGESDVLVEGEQRWQLAPEQVAKLLQQFRAAEYFKLAGFYVASITDNPTYVTWLSIGSQQKFVYDYAGRLLGQPRMPAPSRAGPTTMPKSVTALEDAIDLATGSASWIEGDEHTMEKLRQAKWDFRSKAAGRGLAASISRCKVDLAREFIGAGAPVDVPGTGFSGGPAVADAVQCDDLELVRLLEAKGALVRKGDAQSFLLQSARAGLPDLVKLALGHVSPVGVKDRSDVPLIHLAAAAARFAEIPLPRLAFDPAQVVRLLLDAGADANARNPKGATPLEVTRSEKVAQVLLAAGARLPKDPKRLDLMISHAIEGKWTQLLPMLEKAAEQAGR